MPTYYAQVSYTGDGSTTQYAITFDYIDSTHVKAYLDGIATSAFTVSSSTLTFTTAPANGVTVRIERATPIDARLTDFTDGSVLTEADLDQSANQNFYVAQEITDAQENNLQLDTDDKFDARSKVIKNVADPVNNTDAVNKQFISTNLPNITTVAGIASDVTTVAGISANVTTVAGNNTNVSTVATNIASVNTVATNIADVITVANDLNEAISEIETTANDLNEAVSEIDTVGTNITSVQTVGDAITNVNTVATNIANVNTVAGNNTNITTVAGISGNITTVAGITADVSSVAGNSTNINTVAGDIGNVGIVGSNIANVNAVGTISSDVSSVAGIVADVTTVATNNANVTTVAGSISNVNTVGGAIANVNAVGTDIANVNSVASNLSGVNSFAERYRISSTPPTTSLDVGDLYFDTTDGVMKVYSSGGWINAGSAVNGTANRYKYTATASQTTFSGADDSGNTLAYDAGYLDVYLNGVKIVNGSDFTATNGSSIVLTTGASASDILEVIAYGTFELSNFSITDANDVPALGTAGQVLKVNSGATALEFGAGGLVWENKSANFTAEKGKAYYVDTSSGAITATLPASPSQNDEVRFLDVSGTFDTNNLTVGRNSENIQGDASDLTVATERAGFSLIYYNATQGWLMRDK